MASRTCTPEGSHVVEAFMLLCGVSLCWAGSYALIEIALIGVPPATLAAARLLIAAAMLWGWARLTKAEFPADPALWAWCAAAAVLGQAIPFFAIAWAQTRTTSAETSLLIATTPIFAALFCQFLDRRGVTLRIWIGACLGLVGVGGLVTATVDLTPAGEWWPRAVLLIAAASFAATTWIIARLPAAQPSIIAAIVSGLAAAVQMPIAVVIDQPWRLSITAQTIAAVVVLGAVSTGGAYVAYYRLLRLDGPTFASSHHYLVPAFALVLASMVLGEPLGAVHWIAMALILLGVAMSFPAGGGRHEEPAFFGGRDDRANSRNAAIDTGAGDAGSGGRDTSPA